MKRLLYIFIFSLIGATLNAQLIAAKYSIKNIKANTKYSDYGVTFYNPNEVVFASNAEDAKKITGRLGRIGVDNESFNFDLYRGFVDNKGEINYIKPINNKFTKKYNESNVSFTPDRKYVYFTQNNVKNNKYVSDKNNWVNLKIYRARIQSNGEWTNIEELPFNSDNYSCAHPSLSEDGKILFFSSDMPGSYGKSDIYWVTVHDDGTFGDPVNMGEHVNSSYKENFPFIDGNILYFSSDKPGGKGGLDVYMIRINSDTDHPVNLGTPINSPYDDFCFVVDRKNKRGFFSSNRPNGKGSDDIYYFKQKTEIKKCERLISGTVKSKQDNTILAGARVTLYNAKGLPLESYVTGTDGKYHFQTGCGETLKLITSKDDFIPVTHLLDTKAHKIQQNFKLEKKQLVAATPKKPKPEIAKPAKPTTKPQKPKFQDKKEIPETGKEEKTIAETPEEEPLTIEKEGREILNVPPIYFELDSYKLQKDSKNVLDKVVQILIKHPEIRVEFGAHTDCRASKAYNLHLSQLRAQEVVKYILNTGLISPDRISGKGYGESMPVNHCVDGVPCTEKEHLMNRRAEFVILR